MPVPKWNDRELRAGTMVRTALWLITEIGLGNVFTKEQHRSAFSGIAQADRRLRDLRRYGWVIHTSKEDISLRTFEQRFVAVGVRVWEEGQSRTVQSDVLSNKARRRVLADFDFQCATCGVAAGERYADAPMVSAVLSVSTLQASLRSEGTEPVYVAECARCRSGASNVEIDIPAFVERVRALSTSDRLHLRSWILNGRTRELDRAWATTRVLSESQRRVLVGMLDQLG